MSGTTYRAAYLTSTDGQGEIVLTGPEHAGMAYEHLVDEAIAEVRRADILRDTTDDQIAASLTIGDWTDPDASDEPEPAPEGPEPSSLSLEQTMRYEATRAPSDPYEITTSQHETGASMLVRGRSQHWPNDNLRPYVYGELRYHEWNRKTQWVVDCQCEQGDDRRTQWNLTRSHETRESAVAEVAEFMLVALGILEASCRTGLVQPTPGRCRTDAALRALATDPDHLELCAAFEEANAAEDRAEAKLAAAATEARRKLQLRRLLSIARERGDARDVRDAHRRDFVQSFHRANDWRNYVTG